MVPTMGCLHAGHLSLVRRARRLVGRRGEVVVSIYVNPTQFGPREDFARYPRNLARDAQLCRAEGVDVIFAPDDEQMYPRDSEGAGYSTYVVEEHLSRVMEGQARPTHFRGVTTVVAKLFNIVQPELAVFGAKDYQQAAIIRRMVRDLNFPLRLIVAPCCAENAVQKSAPHSAGLWRFPQSRHPARQAVRCCSSESGSPSWPTTRPRCAAPCSTRRSRPGCRRPGSNAPRPSLCRCWPDTTGRPGAARQTDHPASAAPSWHVQDRCGA